MERLKLDPKKSKIFLLPSEAETTVIQTSPVLAITCLMPKATRRTLVNYYEGREDTTCEAAIDVPPLLWTQLFVKWNTPHLIRFICPCFHCTFDSSMELAQRSYDGSNNYNRFFTHAIDFLKTTDNQIWGAAYTMANNDHGYVCWGKIPYPYSLKKAHVDYWQSIHNNSPNRYFPFKHIGIERSQELADYMQKYQPTKWQDLTMFILGEKNFYAPGKVDGVLISFDEQLKTKFPNSMDKDNVFIGFANRGDGNWEIMKKEIEFQVEDNLMAR
jgi:hypothetical protein